MRQDLPAPAAAYQVDVASPGRSAQSAPAGRSHQAGQLLQRRGAGAHLVDVQPDREQLSGLHLGVKCRGVCVK